MPLEKPGPSRSSHWYYDIILRSLRLPIIRHFNPWGHQSEPPKVAVFKNRRIALTKCIIHIIPLGAALGLIILNVATTPISGYNTTSNSAIQFAAKLLEILMQASLTSVYLAFIRHRVLSTNQSPLGGFLGPLQVSNVSYLWSLEFWGALTASWSGLFDKSILFSVTFIVVAIGALVGPSGAVLMIPRRISVPTGNYLAILDDPAILYPTTINWPVPSDSAYVSRPFFDECSLHVVETISWLPRCLQSSAILQQLQLDNRQRPRNSSTAMVSMPLAQHIGTVPLTWPP